MFTAGAVLVYDLPLPSCTQRHGVLALNPVDYSCVSDPAVGTTWQSNVSTAPLLGTATVASLLVFGLGGPVDGVSAFGFELLALPPFTPVLASTSGVFSVAIPFEPSLLGAPFATQGARIESAPASAFVVLTNAQDVVVGL